MGVWSYEITFVIVMFGGGNIVVTFGVGMSSFLGSPIITWKKSNFAKNSLLFRSREFRLFVQGLKFD